MSVVLVCHFLVFLGFFLRFIIVEVFEFYRAFYALSSISHYKMYNTLYQKSSPKSRAHYNKKALDLGQRVTPFYALDLGQRVTPFYALDIGLDFRYNICNNGR